MSIKHWSHFFACGFGSGLVKKAPGTIGSIVALLIWLFCIQHLSFINAVFFNIIVFFLGVWLCGKTADDWQINDPKAIVWDEFSGMWIALLPLQQNPNLWFVLTAFLGFRVLDICKPWPISSLEKKLPRGWGIMADDVAAGVISGLIVVLLTLGVN